MTALAWAAASCGAAVAAGVTVLVAAWRLGDEPLPAGPQPRRSQLRGLTAGAGRARTAGWAGVGIGVWVVTGWPVAGLALAGVGLGSPWLLGSSRVAQERIERIEAMGAWCRRMSDTLVGGGTVGLAQAVVGSAPHAPAPIAIPVSRLAARIRAGNGDPVEVLGEFADAVDDRVGDGVAAALALALHQQSTGVARVLRQLADGVARDVRARRDIEAERAEARQSIRMLLLIQAGVLGLLALVPGFAAPYRDGAGQVVMALLLAGTLALLVWMRRIALGQRAPRFLGGAG